MGVWSPDRALRWATLLRASLVGGAVGIVGLSAAGLILYDAAGLAEAGVGFLVTILVAFGVGLWAGAPGAEADPLPLQERWLLAGVGTGVAGVFVLARNAADVLDGGALGGPLTLLIVVAGPVYLLGFLLPILFVRAEREEQERGDEDGWGALGLVVVGFIAGMGGGIVAAGLLMPLVETGFLHIAVALVLLAPIPFADPDPPPAQEACLDERTTPFSTLRVVEIVYPGEREPERRLLLNDEEESAELVRSGAPTLAYVAAAERWLGSVSPAGGTYLFLGGGAYTLPRRIAERDPRARITVVEVDPQVTRVAYRFFGLRPEHGITSVHGDARAFLERAGGGEFDRIYVDVYEGREALPYSLVTVEAFERLRHSLRPGGLVAANLIGTPTGPAGPRFWSIVRTFAEVFPATALYTHLGPDFPEPQNTLLAGSLDAEATLPQSAGLFDRWPREEWALESGMTIFRDLFPAAPQRETGRS